MPSYLEILSSANALCRKAEWDPNSLNTQKEMIREDDMVEVMVYPWAEYQLLISIRQKESSDYELLTGTVVTVSTKNTHESYLLQRHGRVIVPIPKERFTIVLSPQNHKSAG